MSDVSSTRSSPDENIQTVASRTPSSIYHNSNGNDSSHKRKRSGTYDAGRSSPRQYDYSPPKRTEHSQHLADQALHALGTSDNHDSQQYYPTPTSANPSVQAWTQDQAQPPHSGNDVGEEQWDSPGANGYDMNGNGMVPKRKRNFSNRTKTGCMTCRRRKKKCDEARPHCMS